MPMGSGTAAAFFKVFYTLSKHRQEYYHNCIAYSFYLFYFYSGIRVFTR